MILVLHSGQAFGFSTREVHLYLHFLHCCLFILKVVNNVRLRIGTKDRSSRDSLEGKAVVIGGGKFQIPFVRLFLSPHITPLSISPFNEPKPFHPRPITYRLLGILYIIVVVCTSSIYRYTCGLRFCQVIY